MCPIILGFWFNSYKKHSTFVSACLFHFSWFDVWFFTCDRHCTCLFAQFVLYLLRKDTIYIIQMPIKLFNTNMNSLVLFLHWFIKLNMIKLNGCSLFAPHPFILCTAWSCAQIENGEAIPNSAQPYCFRCEVKDDGFYDDNER